MASPTMINSNQIGDAAPRQNGTAEPLSRDVVNAELKMAGKRGPETVPLRANASTKSNVVLVRRIKRKNVSPMEQFTGWLVNNQTGLAFNLIALLFLAHSFFPSLRAHTTKFFTLSYFNPQTGRYGVGSDDTYFIVFFVVLLTGVRTFTIDYILSPFARRWNLSKKKELARFGEQGWLLIYCAVFWSMGVYLYYSSPAWLNLRNLWAHWPNREMDTLMKWYQLIQLAFWLQQIFVVNIEPRRKDHWQMFSHHILTITLVYCSIRYHHTPVGNLILILMDIGDLTLAIAKCSKYLGYSNFCDYMFGVFMASWFVCRQVIFPMVIYSVWKHTGEVMPIACFRGSHSEMSGPMDPPTDNNWYLLDPLVDSEGLVCFNSTVKWSFLSVLLVLNLIILVWFTMIVRVAVRVISGTGADDVRSDDEGESEEEDEFVYEEAQPLEEEVGVEDIDLKGWERRSGVKRQASSATGVSLPGHSDRKELLGRIGCEKQVD